MNQPKDSAYTTPRLDRFGTLRQLTQLGSTQSDDFLAGFGASSPTGCNAGDDSKYGCSDGRS